MNFKFIFLALFFFTYGVSASAHTPSRIQIYHALQKIRLHYGASAAVLTISKAGHQTITFYDGKINKDSRQRVNGYNLFQVGSITKSFIAVLMLKLEEQRLVNLHDSITRYLPQYPHWQKITIRELLNHTSGVFNYTKSPELMNEIRSDRQREFTEEQLVAVAYDKPLQFAPGKGWYYSNTNYILAGMIIQKVTHQSISHLLRTRIFQPLTLTETYYLPGDYPQSIERRLVMGYTPEGKPIRDTNASWIGAAGALVSNSSNVVSWIKALFQHQIITTTQLHEMTEAVAYQQGLPLPAYSHEAGYGLGLKYRYDSSLGAIWFHPGVTSGFTAIVAWLPQEHLAIGLTINRDLNSSSLANHFADPILTLFRPQ